VPPPKSSIEKKREQSKTHPDLDQKGGAPRKKRAQKTSEVQSIAPDHLKRGGDKKNNDGRPSTKPSNPSQQKEKKAEKQEKNLTTKAFL